MMQRSRRPTSGQPSFVPFSTFLDPRQISYTMESDGDDHIDKKPRTVDKEPTVQCSVQQFLTVPLPIIFRQVDGGGGKPLLTRAEAQALLRITNLACEFDILVDLISQALERQLVARQLRADVQSIPTLRSLVPTLVAHGQEIPQQALERLQTELDRVLVELEACGVQLKQFSEQNWTMSDSLLEAFGATPSSGHTLANEKRILADIEEDLATRLEHLDRPFEGYKEEDLSMAKVCYRSFGEEPPPEEPPSEEQQEEEQQPRENSIVSIAAQVETATEAFLAHEESFTVGLPNNDKIDFASKPEAHDVAAADDDEDNAEGAPESSDDDDDVTTMHSPRKEAAAQALSHLNDEMEEDEDDYRQDEDTLPLPDIANTQTAVSTLAGLSHG